MPKTDPHFLHALPQEARNLALSSPGTVSRWLTLEAITRYDLDDALLDVEATAFVPMLRQLGITSVIFECDDGWTPIPVDRIPEVLTSYPG